MKIYSEDVEFLKELFSQSEIDLYFFHEKYRLSPAQLSRTINKFIKMDLIALKGNNITLNETGKKWIVTQRKHLFLNESRKYWKQVPDDMAQNTTPINELYKPNRTNIDVELFKNLEDGK